MRTDIKLTYQDYRALPEGGPRYQLIDGDLVACSSSKFSHQEALGRLAIALHSHIESRAMGTVVIAPFDVILSDVNVVQPDVLFVSRARASILRDDGVFGAPDLCVEVLSTHPELDLNTKRHLYARFGVQEYWIVDPDRKTLHVYRLQENAEAPAHIHDASGLLTSILLPGFELPLDKFFAK